MDVKLDIGLGTGHRIRPADVRRDLQVLTSHGWTAWVVSRGILWAGQLFLGPR
jgi:hypothetical protein